MTVSVPADRPRWRLTLFVVLPLVAAVSACSSNGATSGSTTTVSSPPTTAGAAATTATTATTAPPSTTAPASTTACIFGIWKVTSPVAYSGSSWDVHPDGSILVDYAGALSGPATFKTTLPANPQGASGSYIATPVSQHVTASGRTVTLTAHNTAWTCQGNALTLDVSPVGTFQLSRTGS